jgi:hypothetical protein
MISMNKEKLIKVIKVAGIVFVFVGVIFALLYNTYSIETAFKSVERKNGLIIIHHPGRYNEPAEWYNSIFNQFPDTIVGLEVLNQGQRYPKDIALWDSINSLREPDKLIWGYSSDDYHSPQHAFRNYEHMLMENLTEDALRECMIRGAFYFSYQPNGNNETATTYGTALAPKITSVSVSGTMITLQAINYTLVSWLNSTGDVITNGTSIDVAGLSTKFVRAVIYNLEGTTFSQPFGINNGEIINPYRDVNWATAKHYKANFHTHTQKSDGKETVEQVIMRYHSAGYAILAITDHSKNTWPWSDHIQYKPAEASNKAEFYPDLNMLAISGNEPSASHHFSTLFCDYAGNALDLPGQIKGRW